MLETLNTHLKAHCDDLSSINPKVALSEEYWKKIDEIVECLKPCKKAMIQLQKEDLTLTDIYKIFNICHMATAEMGNWKTFLFI